MRLVTTPTAPTPDQPPDPLGRCVGDAGAFLDTSYTVEPHLRRGGDFGDLLSLADVDRAITGTALRTPAIRLVRDGQVLDSSTFTRRVRTGSTWVDGVVHPSRLLQQVADGATVVLQSLQRWWPPVTDFCRALEVQLEQPVQANAYLTPAGATGLAPHHDTHDVFVLQLHGSKHWVVRSPLVASPLARHHSSPGPAGEQPVLLDVELQAGDCLYLPRGFVHSAHAQTGTSLHLTVGVLATTIHDLLRDVVDRTADEPSFRRSLPIGYATENDVAMQTVKAAVDELAQWLGELDPAAHAEDLQRRFWSNRTAPTAGQLIELAGLDSIGDPTIVQRRPGVNATVVSGGPTLRIRMVDRDLTLPPALDGAVRLLVDGAPHRVGELDEWLDAPSRLVLARRLVREGLLRTVGRAHPADV